MVDGGVQLPVHTHPPEPDSGREESLANVCECRGMSPQRTFLCLRLAGGFDGSANELEPPSCPSHLPRSDIIFVYAASITQQQDEEAL